MMKTHMTMEDHITKNLLQLNQEKEIIRSGQVLISSLIEEIKKQIGNSLKSSNAA